MAEWAKTLSKEFVKVDEANFEIVETRETTTNIHIEWFLAQMDKFRNEIKDRLITERQHEEMLKWAIQTFNDAVADLVTAKEKLWYDYEVPTEVSLEILTKEIDEQKDTECVEWEAVSWDGQSETNTASETEDVTPAEETN